MSYLLRALKKSQTERAVASTSGEGTVAFLPHVTQAAPRRTRTLPILLVVNGILLALIVTSLPVLYFRWVDESERAAQRSESARPLVNSSPQITSAKDTTTFKAPSDGDPRNELSDGTRGPLAVGDGATSRPLPVWAIGKAAFGGSVPVDHLWRPGLEPLTWKVPPRSRFGSPKVRLALGPSSRRIPGAYRQVAVAPQSSRHGEASPSPVRQPIQSGTAEQDRQVGMVLKDLPARDGGDQSGEGSKPGLDERLAALHTAVARKDQMLDPEAGTPRMEQLPLSVLRELPELVISIHAYDPAPEKRFVRLNRSKYKEGDRVSKDLWLRSITPKGVILRYGKTDFMMSAN